MAKQPKKMITGKVVNKKVFDTLVSRHSSMTSDMAETRGDLGSFMKDIEETHGVHRGAFKLAVKLHKMDDLKAKDFLRGFDLYREYLKLDERGSADILDDDEADEGESRDGEPDQQQDDWDANAPDENEAERPGVVKVGGETVALGEFQRRLEENNAKPKANPLDDLTGAKH